MSRITGGEVAKLIDAYSSVYSSEDPHEEVTENIEQIDEAPYIPSFDPRSMFTKKGIEAENARRIALEKQEAEKARKREAERQKGKPASAKSQPKPSPIDKEVEAARKQSDVGYRVGQGLLGAVRDLPGGLAAQLQGKPSPELQRQQARVQKLGQLISTGTLPATAGPAANRPATATVSPAARPAAKPAPTSRPAAPVAARPAASAPVARPAVTKPAAAALRPIAQTGDKAKDTAVWAQRFPKLAARVVPSGERAGTQMGTGQSVMAKQAAELRSMQQASQARQAAQSGPMYSSPDVKSKMSTKAKTLLGVKEQYDAYDLVLEYLFSQGHVETLEEALYVMMEMPAETIQGIVEGIMPEPINPDAHKEAQRLARQQGKVRALEAGAATPGEKQAAQGKLRGPQLPGV